MKRSFLSNIILVNQKYFMYLIPLDFSQRPSGLCQTPDAENFQKCLLD